MPPRLRLDSAAFLVGAGVSIPSGIASGQLFTRTFLPRLIPFDLAGDERTRALREPARPRRHPVRGTIRFEQLMEIVRGVADPELLITLYLESSWTPVPMHEWLAAAAAGGAVVMTTNLDSLIELAHLQRFGRPLRQVADRAGYLDFDGGPALLKLHGTIRRGPFVERIAAGATPERFGAASDRAVETFGVTLDRIGALAPNGRATGMAFLLPPYVLDALERALRGRDLVVAGYSGSDDFDVMPSLRQLIDCYERVFWIDHRSGGELRVHERGKLTYVRGPTAAAIAALFGVTLPSAPTPPVDAERALVEFCDAWSAKLTITEEQKYLMTGAILNGMRMLSHSLSVWESGIDTVSTRDPATAARFYVSLGDAYLDERSWYFAEEVFETAIHRTQKTEELVPHARALLGYATVLLVIGAVHERPKTILHAQGLLAYFFGAARVDPALAECEVRAAIAVCALARMDDDDGPVDDHTGGVYRDRIALLRHYAEWPLFQEQKLLRAEYLAELALALFDRGYDEEAEVLERELMSLSAALHLPLLRATYVLELADVRGRLDPASAEAAYTRAETLFRRAGYPVGVAEAILGRTVMAALQGRGGDAGGLREAAETFQDEHLDWNRSQLYDVCAVDRPCADDIRDHFYATLRKFRREHLGKAGWITARQSRERTTS